MSDPASQATTPSTVVAIAASAGGLRALGDVLGALPPGFSAAILVVQHLAPHHRSFLASILSRQCTMPVREAREGDPVIPGTVLVAPPDLHLLVNSDRTLSLSRAELVHFVRPSADLLFESVAACFKDRAIAVVLSGMGRDGSTGVQAIHKMGGKVIAQDDSAEFTSMPHAAVLTGIVDFVLPLHEIPAALVNLATGVKVG
jgi:two-component system chemotaxis response regulator CheB